jgi:hypothetical protein
MAKNFQVSYRVMQKLAERHNVTRDEVCECFLNRTGPSYFDNRENHKTDPPTMWFCAPTDRGRILKIAYVEYDDVLSLKTAFEPTDGSDALYERLCARDAL